MSQLFRWDGGGGGTKVVKIHNFFFISNEPFPIIELFIVDAEEILRKFNFTFDHDFGPGSLPGTSNWMSQKTLLSGGLELVLILSYICVCITGLCANTALIYIIVGKYLSIILMYQI